MRRFLLILVLQATAAVAQPCGPENEATLRLALVNSTRNALRVLDKDALRLADAYGPDEGAHGATLLGGHLFGTGALCVPDERHHDELGTAVWGGEVHTRLGAGFGLRALMLSNSNASSGWSTAYQPEFQHLVAGGFLHYRSLVEIGVLRVQQGAANLPGAVDGWMFSAASLGLRTTLLLGDDAVQEATLALQPLPLGPLDLGGGVRLLPEEDLTTAIIDVRNLALAGNRMVGVLLDSRTELELQTGRLRASTLVVRATWDVPLAPMPDAALRRAPSIRLFTNLQLMGSVFAGSPLERVGRSALPGGGMAWEIGLYGRNAGFSAEAMSWAHEPSVVEFAEEPEGAFLARFMARFRLNL